MDADAVTDLGAYGLRTAQQLESLSTLLAWDPLPIRTGLVQIARCCSCRRGTEAPRQIQDQGVIRTLDPDSESETEATADPCEAVLVGLELQGKPRALAPEGCEDRAASEPTRLLSEDLQMCLTLVVGSVLVFATITASCTCFRVKGGSAVWYPALAVFTGASWYFLVPEAFS